MFTFVPRVPPGFKWLGAASIFCAFAYTASAQTNEFPLAQIEPATTGTPYALFQYSTLSGSGNTVTITMVPVVNAAGTIYYKNVTLQFDVSTNGTLTLGSTQVVLAPTPIISAFAAGRYVGPSTIYSGNMIVNVSGPGVASGGVTEWGLSAASGATCYTYPATATWYVGPLADSPLAARVKAAGINTTATTMYFGVASPACFTSNYWDRDTLIGVSQVGNSLTIASFSYNGADYSTIQDQITYTVAP
jgi:hypothetical protein